MHSGSNDETKGYITRERVPVIHSRRMECIGIHGESTVLLRPDNHVRLRPGQGTTTADEEAPANVVVTSAGQNLIKRGCIGNKLLGFFFTHGKKDVNWKIR